MVLRDLVCQGVQISVKKGPVKNPFQLGFAVEVPADRLSEAEHRKFMVLFFGAL